MVFECYVPSYFPKPVRSTVLGLPIKALCENAEWLRNYAPDLVLLG
jgi:hypothetical protein